jgi:pyridoxamine 5'-phosphate oxidase
MQKTLFEIRRDYSQQAFTEAQADPDPIVQFSQWFEEVVRSEIVEANAMTLATASSDGLPSARTVLLKVFGPEGFIFFTNYESFKSQQLLENPKACLVFFWKELERQVRITGLVSKTGAKESDEYFLSRPRASQLAALASPQSRVIESREWLDKQYTALTAKANESELKRPAHWGGFLVKPVVMEFWQGRPNRLHDRIQYTLMENGTWKMERLAP